MKLLRKKAIVKQVNPQDAVNKLHMEKLRKLEAGVAELKEVLVGQGLYINLGQKELKKQIEEAKREVAGIYDILENGELKSHWVFGERHD